MSLTAAYDWRDKNMFKINRNEQTVDRAATAAETTVQPSGSSPVAQLAALHNVPQTLPAGWSRVVAGEHHRDPAPALLSNILASESFPEAVELAAADLTRPPPFLPRQAAMLQDISTAARADMTEALVPKEGYAQPAWQRATRSWRTTQPQTDRPAQQHNRARGRGRGQFRHRATGSGTGAVAWQLTLPAGTSDDSVTSTQESRDQYRELARYWKNIQICTEKMNLRQLNREMGKLNQALGQTRGSLNDVISPPGEPAGQGALSQEMVEGLAHNVTLVMASMGTRALHSEAPAFTISAIFSGLRALAKVGFAQLSTQAAVTLREAYSAALGAMTACPAERNNARMIAVCLNGLKEAVANAVFPASDETIRAAAGWLIARAASRYFSDPQAQNIANVLNGLKTMLDYQVLQTHDLELQQATSKLLARLCSSEFAQADELEIANAFNGLKAVLDHRLLLPDHPQVALAARKLLMMIHTPTGVKEDREQQERSCAFAQPIANALNGVKALLDHNVLSPADPQMRHAAETLLDRVASEQFAQADTQNISNGFSGLKAILDYGVLPPEHRHVRAAVMQLLARLNSMRFNSVRPQNIANTLSGLKATLDHRALRAEDDLMQSAAKRLMELALSADFARAEAQEIANILSGFKSVMDFGLLSAEDKPMVPLACHLLTQVTSPQFRPHDAQPVANAMNGLKSMLEHKVIAAEDVRLQLAARHLLQLTHLTLFDAANAQSVANVMNGLRSLLDYNALPVTDELTGKTAQRLLSLIAAPQFNQAIAQNIANAFMGLKTILAYRILPHDSPLVQQAANALTKLVAADNFARADAQRIANGFTGLKVVLERQVLAHDNPWVQRGAHQLLKLAGSQAFHQSLITNPATEQRRANKRKNIPRDGIIALNIANVVSGIKALLDYRVVAPAEQQLRKTVNSVLGMAASPLFSQADGRNIAHLHNGMKAVLEHQVLSPQNAQLQHTASALLAQTAHYDFTGEDSQTVANTFNGLKALLDASVLQPDNPLLQQAVRRLLTPVTLPGFGAGDDQGVTNTLNGVKAVLEHGVLRSGDELIGAATRQLLVLVRDMAFHHGELAQEGTQTIANAFNGLKTTLDYQIIPAGSVLVRQVAEKLLQLTQSGHFAGATAQGVANSLNDLRALLEYRVLSPHDATLRQAAHRLLEQVLAPGFSHAVAQNITNTLNVALTLTEQGVVAPDAPMLKRIVATLLHLGVAGALDQSFGLNMHYFFRSVTLLHQQFPQLVSDELLREKGLQLSRRIDEQLKLVKKGGAAANSAGLLVQLQQMMSAGWVDAATSWRQCQQLLKLLPGKGVNPGQRAALLSASCRLYGEWRSQPGIQVSLLLDQVIQQARALPWQDFRQRHLAIELHQVCVELDNVRDLLSRGRKGRVKSEALAQLNKIMQQSAVPMLLNAVRRRQVPDEFAVSLREMSLFQRYLPPEQWPQPEFTPWSDAYGERVMREACARLSGTPHAVTSRDELRIIKVNARGKPLLNDAGQPQQRVLANSFYKHLFRHNIAHPLILVQVEEHRQAEDLPVFVSLPGDQPQGKRQFYRTDVLRGSANRRSPGQHAWLWGVPVEIGETLRKWLLTSVESGVYGQRMLLAGASGDEIQPAPQVPTMSGSFHLRLVPETRPEDFPLSGDWAQLQVGDGCGFIHEDLARQWLGEARFAALNATTRGPVPAEGSIPAQALQYYTATAEQSKQIAQEFHAHAISKIGPPLAQRSDIPSVATLAKAARIAGPDLYHLTAVPVAGRKLVIPDDPAWRHILREGAIMGHAPYDTRGLLNIASEDIDFSASLNAARAIQYSLTGFSESVNPDLPPELLGLKGIMIVVPKHAWPAGVSKDELVVSAKEQKVSSAFGALAVRNQRQNPQNTELRVISGMLVCIQTMKELVGVPNASIPAPPDASSDRPSMARLGADYDGDLMALAGRSGLMALAALITQQNRLSRGNPKFPKTLTPARPGELQIEKLQQLHSQLLEHASVITERLLNLPAEVRAGLIRRLSPGHMLQAFYDSDDWPTLAGLQQREGEFARLSEEERAQRIIRCELELLMKAGTDLEKTRVDFPLLRQRMQEYRKELGAWMAQSVPWGKRTVEKLMLAREQYQGETPEYLQAAEDVLKRALADSGNYAGLLASITRENLTYLLGRD